MYILERCIFFSTANLPLYEKLLCTLTMPIEYEDDQVNQTTKPWSNIDFAPTGGKLDNT